MKVFIGLTEIAGYYGALADGFREIGVEADLCSLSTDPYGYERAQPPPVVTWARSSARRRLESQSASTIRKSQLIAAELASRASLLAWAATRYDAFIFAFGGSFFRYHDYRLLRALGKRVICVFNGTDSRPPYMDGMLVPSARSAEALAQKVKESKQRVSTAERFAHAVVNSPATGQFHERPYNCFLSLGLPCAPGKLPARTRTEDGRVRIVHAPTNLAAKGTVLIRSAIAESIERHPNVEYVELVRRPNHEVLQELANCDFVVDQLYSDTPMAGFAAEAARSGRAAVVGGYGWNELKLSIPQSSWPPSHICHPDDIRSAIERLVVDRRYREDLGRAAHDFVCEHWSPARVAERYMLLLQNRPDPTWIRQPGDAVYIYGWGLKDDQVHSAIRDVVRVAGPSALAMDDKPRIREEMLRQAGIGG